MTASTIPSGQAEERPTPAGNPFVACVLAWLVFGLGHLYVGRRWKAAVLFVFLSVMFVGGLSFCHFVYLPVDTGAISKVVGGLGAFGSAWAGLFYAGAVVFLGPSGDLAAPAYEVGWVAVISAALLNLLAILDVWDISVRKKD